MVDSASIAAYRQRQAYGVIADLQAAGCTIPFHSEQVLARQYSRGELTLPDLEMLLICAAFKGEQ